MSSFFLYISPFLNYTFSYSRSLFLCSPIFFTFNDKNWKKETILFKEHDICKKIVVLMCWVVFWCFSWCFYGNIGISVFTMFHVSFLGNRIVLSISVKTKWIFVLCHVDCYLESCARPGLKFLSKMATKVI